VKARGCGAGNAAKHGGFTPLAAEEDGRIVGGIAVNGRRPEAGGRGEVGDSFEVAHAPFRTAPSPSRGTPHGGAPRLITGAGGHGS
jgi:hypothetical protein